MVGGDIVLSHSLNLTQNLKIKNFHLIMESSILLETPQDSFIYSLTYAFVS